jgi:predicted MFS family arabinose efflux permease
LRYAHRDAQIRFLLLTTFVTTFIVYHAALLPVIATDVVHSGASGYALLQSATGVGAILGAVFAGEFTTDHRRRVAIIVSLAGIGGAYTAVSVSTSLAATAVALGFWGLAYFTLSAVVQGLLIAVSPDAFRGRVMGLYSMVTAGGVPIAALIGGALGSLLGPTTAVGVAAVVVFAFLAWVLATRQQRVIRYDPVSQDHADLIGAVSASKR